MPRGVPEKAYLHCRKCEGSKFASISELRKHQWAVHKETFANLAKALKAPRKTMRCTKCGLKFKGQGPLQRHYWATHKDGAAHSVRELELPIPVARHNGDMRVSDLLGELKGQQKFIDDVIALISGIVERHKETAQ